MSLLNQLFNRGVFGTKCKTNLNLSISRIKLLRNKRDLQLKQMRKEIAQFLQAGQEAIARIRVEHVIREQNIWAAYEILELFCEFILARVPIIEIERECPLELREAIASIIFASPRCSDIPDLLHLKSLFSTKYGKEFISSATELRPDSSVNRTVKWLQSLSSLFKMFFLYLYHDFLHLYFIFSFLLQIIEKLSVSTPSPESKLKVLKEISHEYNLKWDSTETEAEFGKKHEDLLGGANQVGNGASNLRVTSKHELSQSSPSNEARQVMPVDTRQQGCEQVNARSPPKSTSSTTTGGMGQTHKISDIVPMCDSNSETRSQSSSDILEKARAAIASAERASAAARAAAALVHINFGSLKLEEGKS